MKVLADELSAPRPRQRLTLGRPDSGVARWARHCTGHGTRPRRTHTHHTHIHTHTTPPTHTTHTHTRTHTPLASYTVRVLTNQDGDSGPVFESAAYFFSHSWGFFLLHFVCFLKTNRLLISQPIADEGRKCSWWPGRRGREI